jgi:hypothetical protein
VEVVLRSVRPPGTILSPRRFGRVDAATTVAYMASPKVFSALQLTLAGVGTMGFLALFVLTSYLSSHRPHEMQEALGLIYPLNEQGDIVYLSFGEHFFMTALPFVSVCLIACAIALRSGR